MIFAFWCWGVACRCASRRRIGWRGRGLWGVVIDGLTVGRRICRGEQCQWRGMQGRIRYRLNHSRDLRVHCPKLVFGGSICFWHGCYPWLCECLSFERVIGRWRVKVEL